MIREKTFLSRMLVMALLLTVLLSCTAVLAVSVGAEEDEATKPVVITLDPGHGGKKSADGSTGTATGAAEQFGGVNELFYTLSISQYCKERLEQYRNVEVHLTRENNEDCPGLKERANMAKDQNADALISIHNNSFSNPSAKGAEIIIPNRNYNA